MWAQLAQVGIAAMQNGSGAPAAAPAVSSATQNNSGWVVTTGKADWLSIGAAAVLGFVVARLWKR